MPRTERDKEKNKERIKEKYDKFTVMVYKGEKEKLQKHLKENGESINGFINRLIAKEYDDFEPIDTTKKSVKK